jgi:dienelactone hydrolase
MRATSLLLFLSSVHVHAQDCSIPFTQPLFGTQQEQGIWYGNATRFNGGTDSLRLNLYKPVGDGQAERPLVIAIHGGGFTGGHRNDLNDYCNTLAGMGWGCATISYRLGYYGNGLFDPPYAYDPNEMRRAIFRAQQDAKGAIRFLKGRHAQDSTSTVNVLLVGFSAGAITALHAAYIDQPGEKPAAANAIGDVQHFLNFYPRPDLGGIDGDLDQNGFDASVLGVVNMFGAVLDTAIIDGADRPALYSYHQSGDLVVACGHDRPYWGIGLGAPDNQPYLYGSCAIDPHVQQLGSTPGHYHFTLHQGNAHDVHDPVGILLETLQWKRELFCGATTSVPQVEHSTAIAIHPNPVADHLIMQGLPVGIQRDYVVFDALGAMVAQGRLTNDRIAVEALPSGSYVLRINSGQEVRHARFIKE